MLGSWWSLTVHRDLTFTSSIDIKVPTHKMNYLSTRISFFLLAGLLLQGYSLVTEQAAYAGGAATWQGILRTTDGSRISDATVELQEIQTGMKHRKTTAKDGFFQFENLSSAQYSVTVSWEQRAYALEGTLDFTGGRQRTGWLELNPDIESVKWRESPLEASSTSRVTEKLSSQEVSELPLNKRDFSQLLLLAAGTTTDTNGAANYTQQFAVNGQRGTASVFAMDGIHTSDPELGGATFSNFNVDAIEEIRSQSGVMLPEVGGGAAGFTDIVTRRGASRIHGSIFEFHRNAALDARNFFDRRSIANPGRIPPFIRNEFGFTNGGPIHKGKQGENETFYFAQYQGFRQVLGTTQVIPVPSPEERQGIDRTTFPGDTLQVPINPEIAPVLSRYPLPNDPQGAYGARTYATSSKVTTTSDQFSIRIDHQFSKKSQLFARFNLNDVDGPLTNPSQTAIDPSFGVRFLDHQRNFGLTYTRFISPQLTSESSIGFMRSTPLFPPLNSTQPALKFADGLYEGFNSAGGTVIGAYGNLYQFRQNLAWVHNAHSLKSGFEVRINRDTTLFGISPNGEYSFGGGRVYSPVEIRSQSGHHDIHVGDPLPDSLTAFLTGTPFSYDIMVSPPLFPQGDRLGECGIWRAAYNGYFQDTWKVTPSVLLNMGVRYEMNTRISEFTLRTAGPRIVDASGQYVPSWAPGARQEHLINPQPPYRKDWSGWGPRLSLEWNPFKKTVLSASGGVTTILPNLFQTDWLTGNFPFLIIPYASVLPGAPILFVNRVVAFQLPEIYNTEGQPVFASGRSTDVAPNTVADLARFQRDLALQTPGQRVSPLNVFGMDRAFRNGYIVNYSLSLEREIGDFKLGAAYVATAGVGLPSISFPNNYAGADPAFAPFTNFDSSGKVIGGIGTEMLMSSRSHSTFHSLQTSIGKTSSRWGLGFQVNYTFSKSLDDTSAAQGGFLSGSSGAVAQAYPQDPRDPRADKGPSNFDVTHVATVSFVQALPLGHLAGIRSLGDRFTSGWQILNVSTLTSGAPFTVYSGIQQTGLGTNNTDRPDQVGHPVLSTTRDVREDYFGKGTDNPSFFSIPIGIDGGTGPNSGSFGTLGRNTFRGPGFHNFDIAVLKSIPLGRVDNPSGPNLQFRAEFFNLFNLVNFGLPANIVRGSGFGLISRTAGPSRQIQISLKFVY